VGLTPGALRFYDDCGVLRPARVDDVTGYRYCTGAQEARGRLLRDLRAVDLPLAEVRTVLDGSPEESARVLRSHVRNAAEKAEATRAAARAGRSCSAGCCSRSSRTRSRWSRPTGTGWRSAGCSRRGRRAERAAPSSTPASWPALLASALSASVGPDVLLDVVAPARPVVVRSADQGTFTTLVMPVRLDG
jgi:DNA-binding transcriptional MerR regulator